MQVNRLLLDTKLILVLLLLLVDKAAKEVSDLCLHGFFGKSSDFHTWKNCNKCAFISWCIV